MLEGLWAGGGKLEEVMHVHLSPSPMVNHLNKRYLPRPLTPTPSCLLISDDSSPFHHAPSFKSSLLHARAHTHMHRFFQRHWKIVVLFCLAPPFSSIPPPPTIPEPAQVLDVYPCRLSKSWRLLLIPASVASSLEHHPKGTGT